MEEGRQWLSMVKGRGGQVAVNGGCGSVGAPMAMMTLTIIIIAMRKVVICNFPRVRKKNNI